MSYTYLNTSDLSEFITNNAYIISAPLKTSVEVDIFLLICNTLLVWINLVSSHF